jgi:hypothetical protein
MISAAKGDVKRAVASLLSTYSLGDGQTIVLELAGLRSVSGESAEEKG